LVVGVNIDGDGDVAWTPAADPASMRGAPATPVLTAHVHVAVAVKVHVDDQDQVNEDVVSATPESSPSM
jgi:hypothetical protein